MAFGNCGGGYEIRNPFFKGCVPPKDVTLLPSGSAVCNVYEGFVDYLSARALGIGGGRTTLSSTRCPMWRGRTGIWTATERCGATLTTTKPGGGHWKPCARYGERVSDCSGIYGGCKDLNEYLQSRLKQNEKNNKNIKLKM